MSRSSVLPSLDELDRHLLFRDYLPVHSEVAEEYARFKYELSSRIRDDREAYTDAKTDFISEVIPRAQENQRS